MVVKNNAYFVDLHRKRIGNARQKEVYHKLRNKYGLSSKQADKMKSWSADRILIYIEDNKIKALDSYVEKAVDRL